METENPMTCSHQKRCIDHGGDSLQDTLMFTLAKRLGSSKNFPTPKENREREEKKEMTPAQIAEAKKLAREWMEEHGKE